MADRIEPRGGISRDAAGVGPHVRPDVELVPLRELKHFDVADGEADIRGWEVRTLGGREIGKVSDLLVDVGAGEVVMLDVDLAGSDRHTLAPVRAAQLDRARRVVLLDSADVQDVDALPALRRDQALTDDEARHFSDRYQKAYGHRGWDRERDYHVVRGADELRFSRRDAALDAAATAESDARMRAQVEEDARRREAAAHDREAESRRRLEESRRREVEMQQRATEQQLADRQQSADAAASRRPVRFPAGAEEEVVVERRPVIEEVVIRRRVVDPDSPEGRALQERAAREQRPEDRA